MTAPARVNPLLLTADQLAALTGIQLEAIGAAMQRHWDAVNEEPDEYDDYTYDDVDAFVRQVDAEQARRAVAEPAPRETGR
jgi:hypothetical protein